MHQVHYGPDKCNFDLLVGAGPSVFWEITDFSTEIVPSSSENVQNYQPIRRLAASSPHIVRVLFGEESLSFWLKHQHGGQFDVSNTDLVTFSDHHSVIFTRSSQ